MAQASGRALRSMMPRAVREPRQQTSGAQSAEKDARMLTSQITMTDSAAELLDLLMQQVQIKIFNEYHGSATVMKLARFKKTGQLRQADLSSAVRGKLSVRMREMFRQDLLSTRCTANVLYAAGEIHDDAHIPFMQVLPSLCETLRAKAAEMNEQDLSNSLLAAAKLQDAAPEALDAAGQDKGYDSSALVQHLVGCCEAPRCITTGADRRARYCKADTAQDRWHDSAAFVQQPVGSCLAPRCFTRGSGCCASPCKAHTE